MSLMLPHAPPIQPCAFFSKHMQPCASVRNWSLTFERTGCVVNYCVSTTSKIGIFGGCDTNWSTSSKQFSRATAIKMTIQVLYNVSGRAKTTCSGVRHSADSSRCCMATYAGSSSAAVPLAMSALISAIKASDGSVQHANIKKALAEIKRTMENSSVRE